MGLEMDKGNGAERRKPRLNNDEKRIADAVTDSVTRAMNKRFDTIDETLEVAGLAHENLAKQFAGLEFRLDNIDKRLEGLEN